MRHAGRLRRCKYTTKNGKCKICTLRRQYREPARLATHGSERDTEAEAEGVDPVEAVGQKVALVGRVTVVEGGMKTEAHVGARKDRDTHLGLEVEAPGVAVLLVDVVVGADLGVGGTDLKPGIGLKDRILEPVVAPRHTKRKVEEGVFLARGEGRAVAELQGLAGILLEVGLVAQEAADGDCIGKEVAALEVHTPPRGFVGKVGRSGHPELPIDVEVGIGQHLCRSRTKPKESHQGQGRRA